MPTFKPLNQLMSPVKQEEPCTVKHLARVEDIQRKSKNVERMFRVAKSNELIMARSVSVHVGTLVWVSPDIRTCTP